MNKPTIIATYTYEQVFRCNDRGGVVFGSWSKWGKWSKYVK